MRNMWEGMSKEERDKNWGKIMFVPSYWFADHIGFIQEPTL